MSGISTGVSHKALKSWRVCVSGSRRLKPENARFCERLGWELAGEQGLVIVTGGSKHPRVPPSPPSPPPLPPVKSPPPPSADWAVVQGALKRLRTEGGREDLRIETLLPDQESTEFERFKAGKTQVLRNLGRQPRRFTLVNSCDALVAVEGHEGTREMIDLALAMEKPCLPLPFTGGFSQVRWHENRNWIREFFDIDEAILQRWESTETAGADDETLAKLAADVQQLLLRRLKRKCFVMMPFKEHFSPLYEEVVKPVIEQEGLMALRADRLNMVGNAIEVVRAAINACDCAIAILTGWNPNVMYEVGFAHAQRKPVILLLDSEAQPDWPKDLPFDLRTDYVIDYRRDRQGDLREKIGEKLRQILGR